MILSHVTSQIWDDSWIRSAAFTHRKWNWIVKYMSISITSNNDYRFLVEGSFTHTHTHTPVAFPTFQLDVDEGMMKIGGVQSHHPVGLDWYVILLPMPVTCVSPPQRHSNICAMRGLGFFFLLGDDHQSIGVLIYLPF